jgi:hypothetical protein
MAHTPPYYRMVIAPCAVFGWFAFLSACVALLHLYPASTFLWWVNVELFTPFRTTYYLLESLLGGSALAIAAVTTTAALLPLAPVLRRSIRMLFILNHCAALLVFASLFTLTATPAALAHGEALRATGLGGLSSLSLAHTSPVTLVLLMICALGCAASHTAVLRRRRAADRRNHLSAQQAVNHGGAAGDRRVTHIPL